MALEVLRPLPRSSGVVPNSIFMTVDATSVPPGPMTRRTDGAVGSNVVPGSGDGGDRCFHWRGDYDHDQEPACVVDRGRRSPRPFGNPRLGERAGGSGGGRDIYAGPGSDQRGGYGVRT